MASGSNSDFSDMEDWNDEEIESNWLSASDDEGQEIANTDESTADKDPNADLPDSSYIRGNADLYRSLIECKDLALNMLPLTAQEDLLKSLTLETYNPGEITFHENDEQSFNLYFIISDDITAESAEVEVVKASSDGEKVLTRLGRGQMFGQKYFLTKNPVKKLSSP